jgi:hypothetical protein
MYEGLILELIGRCQGESKRYEIILELFKDFTLKNDEIQFLSSLLDKETGVDEEGVRRINQARFKLQPYMEFEEMLSSEESEILEGASLMLTLIISFRRSRIWSIWLFALVFNWLVSTF